MEIKGSSSTSAYTTSSSSTTSHAERARVEKTTGTKVEETSAPAPKDEVTIGLQSAMLFKLREDLDKSQKENAALKGEVACLKHTLEEERKIRLKTNVPFQNEKQKGHDKPDGRSYAWMIL